MLDVILPLILLAAVVAALRAAPTYLAKSPTRSLPAPYRLVPRAQWVIERQGITVSATTVALNRVPKRVVNRLPFRARQAVVKLLDVGVIAGVLGSAFAFAVALWSARQVWTAVWFEAEAHARVVDTSAPNILRRDLVPDAPPPVHASTSGAGLLPLIPGITAPLSHVPTMALALLLCQLVHEAGHALAAALEEVSPSKLLFSVHLILPSASVAFPMSVDSLPPRAKARIATSGPFFNLLLWCMLFALGGFSSLLWTDATNQGRIVTSVAPGSGLQSHLSPDYLITHVDDNFIGGAGDLWTKLLAGEVTPDPNRGWCVSKWEFRDAPQAPCPDRHLVSVDEVANERSGTRCLAPHGIIARPSTECQCAPSQVCIRPAAHEQIMRIRYSKPDGKQDTLLWSGDRIAVLNQIQVDSSRPRFWASPTRWLSLFMQYMRLVTLSLFVFNLLTLPYTDGTQLFMALISSSVANNPRSHRSRHSRQLSSAPASRHPTINLYRHGESDSEFEEEPVWEVDLDRREEARQSHIRRVVEGVTSLVVAVVVMGWAMLALLRSS